MRDQKSQAITWFRSLPFAISRCSTGAELRARASCLVASFIIFGTIASFVPDTAVLGSTFCDDTNYYVPDGPDEKVTNDHYVTTVTGANETITDETWVSVVTHADGSKDRTTTVEQTVANAAGDIQSVTRSVTHESS